MWGFLADDEMAAFCLFTKEADRVAVTAGLYCHPAYRLFDGRERERESSAEERASAVACHSTRARALTKTAIGAWDRDVSVTDQLSNQIHCRSSRALLHAEDVQYFTVPNMAEKYIKSCGYNTYGASWYYEQLKPAQIIKVACSLSS